MSKNIHPLICIIDRFENNQAILLIEISKIKQELIVPKRFLPKGVAEGDVLQVEFATDKMAKAKKQNLAHEILEEILKGASEKNQKN